MPSTLHTVNAKLKADEITEMIIFIVQTNFIQLFTRHQTDFFTQKNWRNAAILFLHSLSLLNWFYYLIVFGQLHQLTNRYDNLWPFCCCLSNERPPTKQFFTLMNLLSGALVQNSLTEKKYLWSSLHDKLSMWRGIGGTFAALPVVAPSSTPERTHTHKPFQLQFFTIMRGNFS